MKIESKLCHLSENKAVVQVSGWINDKGLGSALAEGTTVEIAEDKAISRLKKRLNSLNKKTIDNDYNIEVEEKNKLSNEEKIEVNRNDELAKANINNTVRDNKEPSDWSNELIAIDSEIKRLNWSRDDEMKFLKSTFGFNNRAKITKYNELVKYLNILKDIDNSNLTKTSTNNMNILIEESDNILRDLSWDKKQGREYLQKHFNVSTRYELGEEQLISFVDNLKLIRNEYSSK